MKEIYGSMDAAYLVKIESWTVWASDFPQYFIHIPLIMPGAESREKNPYVV